METEELTQITQEEAAPPESGVKPADAGQEQASTQPQRLSWEQILADPDYKSCYDASVQEIVQRRLRDRNRAEQTLQQLQPVLRALEEVCGVHPEDSEALCGRIYELGRGGAPDEGQLREHLARLMAEGERLKSRLPDFDLERELENPDFLRLTAPHSGVGLEDAFFALHRDSIAQSAARESLAALSRSMRRQQLRPRESRAGQTPVPAGAGSMSRAEREALKKRILEAKAQGRRLSVGE